MAWQSNTTLNRATSTKAIGNLPSGFVSRGLPAVTFNAAAILESFGNPSAVAARKYIGAPADYDSQEEQSYSDGDSSSVASNESSEGDPEILRRVEALKARAHAVTRSNQESKIRLKRLLHTLQEEDDVAAQDIVDPLRGWVDDVPKSPGMIGVKESGDVAVWKPQWGAFPQLQCEEEGFWVTLPESSAFDAVVPTTVPPEPDSPGQPEPEVVTTTFFEDLDETVIQVRSPEHSSQSSHSTPVQMMQPVGPCSRPPSLSEVVPLPSDALAPRTNSASALSLRSSSMRYSPITAAEIRHAPNDGAPPASTEPQWLALSSNHVNMYSSTPALPILAAVNSVAAVEAIPASSPRLTGRRASAPHSTSSAASTITTPAPAASPTRRMVARPPPVDASQDPSLHGPHRPKQFVPTPVRVTVLPKPVPTHTMEMPLSPGPDTPVALRVATNSGFPKRPGTRSLSQPSRAPDTNSPPYFESNDLAAPVVASLESVLLQAHRASHNQEVTGEVIRRSPDRPPQQPPVAVRSAAVVMPAPIFPQNFHPFRIGLADTQYQPMQLPLRKGVVPTVADMQVLHVNKGPKQRSVIMPGEGSTLAKTRVLARQASAGPHLLVPTPSDGGFVMRSNSSFLALAGRKVG